MTLDPLFLGGPLVAVQHGTEKGAGMCLLVLAGKMSARVKYGQATGSSLFAVAKLYQMEIAYFSSNFLENVRSHERKGHGKARIGFNSVSVHETDCADEPCGEFVSSPGLGSGLLVDIGVGCPDAAEAEGELMGSTAMLDGVVFASVATRFRSSSISWSPNANVRFVISCEDGSMPGSSGTESHELFGAGCTKLKLSKGIGGSAK